MKTAYYTQLPASHKSLVNLPAPCFVTEKTLNLDLATQWVVPTISMGEMRDKCLLPLALGNEADESGAGERTDTWTDMWVKQKTQIKDSIATICWLASVSMALFKEQSIRRNIILYFFFFFPTNKYVLLGDTDSSNLVPSPAYRQIVVRSSVTPVRSTHPFTRVWENRNLW